jgi:hypothetical protein
LNVCGERLAELELRKRIISSRIAMQRTELEEGFQRLRAPLRAFDKAKAVGAKIREHGPAVAMALAPVLFLLRRPLGGGVGLAAGLVKKATRWWALWKTGSRLFSTITGAAKRRQYAR